ncbi:ANTAR domain-containing response regulator [Clostridium formicaceticum]|uniref:Stage 0 sporulation protein A homolog n=1 Tax=Clostridium formicaceticum TaxID=1497 RepID=A0AAC9WGU9_9CLOT|nr:ANTAR domain-containing protein [Clostridium formicaceticum]ARE88199.1 putative transcriptional regulatory protein pdtaR [Clostridium formicaceticum]
MADSGETSRKWIYTALMKKGYKVYEASDAAGTLRICRSIFPKLVLIDTGIWGMSPHKLAGIIEGDGLSTVLFITSKPDDFFHEQLKKMKVCAYISKPVNAPQLYQMIEFILTSVEKINFLEKQVEKLESSLAGRKKIDRAKGILMEKLKMSENDAYKLLRKKSMDACTPIEKMAETIISEYS